MATLRANSSKFQVVISDYIENMESTSIESDGSDIEIAKREEIPVDMATNGFHLLRNDRRMRHINSDKPLDMAQMFISDDEEEEFNGYQADWMTNRKYFIGNL